jgi:hypothetical protein
VIIDILCSLSRVPPNYVGGIVPPELPASFLPLSAGIPISSLPGQFPISKGYWIIQPKNFNAPCPEVIDYVIWQEMFLQEN